MTLCVFELCVYLAISLKYQHLIRILIALYDIGSYIRSIVMMIAICFYKEITFYLSESPLTRIYARLAIKGEERNVRLAKLHKMPSSVVSILFLGASRPYRSARPTDFHLISFRLRRIYADPSRRCTKCRSEIIERGDFVVSFSTKSVSRSDFILSLREDMAGVPRVSRIFAIIQLLNR